MYMPGPLADRLEPLEDGDVGGGVGGGGHGERPTVPTVARPVKCSCGPPRGAGAISRSPSRSPVTSARAGRRRPPRPAPSRSTSTSSRGRGPRPGSRRFPSRSRRTRGLSRLSSPWRPPSFSSTPRSPREATRRVRSFRAATLLSACSLPLAALRLLPGPGGPALGGAAIVLVVLASVAHRALSSRRSEGTASRLVSRVRLLLEGLGLVALRRLARPPPLGPRPPRAARLLVALPPAPLDRRPDRPVAPGRGNGPDPFGGARREDGDGEELPPAPPGPAAAARG